MNNLFSCFTIVVSLATVFSGCGKTDDRAGQDVTAANAVRVKTEVADSRIFENRLAVQGSVEALISADVSSRISGILDSVWVDEGDSVISNETRLFQIDPVSLSNQVVVARQALAVAYSQHEVAKASLGSAKASYDKAKLDFDRYKRLHDEKRVTDNEFELCDTALRQEKANLLVGEANVKLCAQQVEQAEAQLAIALKSLSDSLVFAPISGRVSVRNFEPGEYASSGNVVVSIVDVENLEVAAFIPAVYFDTVKIGKTALRLSAGGRDLGEAVISYRSPVIDTTLRTVEIKAKLDNGTAKAFAPGMMVDATIVFERHEAIGVPSSSILNRGGKSVVFVVNNGKVEKRIVAPGMNTDGWTEILSGLKSGEQVICEGHTIVREGALVEIVK